MSSPIEPVKLMIDSETGDRFLVYSTAKGLRLDIRFEGESLWMTQAQIGELFGKDQSLISKHINNIIKDGELEAESNMQKVHIAPASKPTTLYSLDMVISIGYRVSSSQATLFRRWATGVLVQYAKKGFVVDSIRLKSKDAGDRIAELRDVIRDLRSDEANVYRELRQICSMCQDYVAGSTAATRFFQHTQAKLVFAVTSQTPAEIVSSRADHRQLNMRLTNWSNERIRKEDVSTSKNYLADAEIRELNRLTTILLDVFEDQLDLGRLIVMADTERLLDQQLQQLGRTVLSSGGSIKSEDAKRLAEQEYVSFTELQKAQRHALADQSIDDLAKAAKELPKGKGRSQRRSPPRE
jgi:hypothetical protein